MNEEYIASDGSVLEPGMMVLVRNSNDNLWVISLFSFAIKLVSCTCFTCANGINFKYCIPFKNNEHLLGTINNFVNKTEFKFGDKVYVKNWDCDKWCEAVFLNYNKNITDDRKYKVVTEDLDEPTYYKYCKLMNN